MPVLWVPRLHISAMAGAVTRITGTWAMPRSRARIKKIPTAGMLAISMITPTSSAWINATPMTPWATARMVLVHRRVRVTPLFSSVIRMAIRWALMAPAAPQAIIIPETINEIIKPISPPLMLAKILRNCLAMSPICER